jgi:beta-glucanase (GH16 family)
MARLKSENKFEFTYGKVEVRAKLTTGADLAAIWMLAKITRLILGQAAVKLI